MRLIDTLQNQQEGNKLSALLTSKEIENQLEVLSNSDWGSPSYGDVTCRLWVIDEDKVELAVKWVEAYKSNPNDPSFQNLPIPTPPPILPVNIFEVPEQKPITPEPLPTSTKSVVKTFQANITFYLVLICCLFFIIDTSTEPHVTTLPKDLPSTPILSSPLLKKTFYDYPAPYAMVDKLINLYGIEKVQQPDSLPSDGQYILKEIQRTPYWKGIYPQLVEKIKKPDTPWNFQGPFFEKIRQGEVWRLLSPCIMHSDILHLLFNMLWLIVLGQQMEQRLSPRRYVLFAVIAGIFSNTCQYFMSGSNFIGYSGIVCAMVAFIWMRQKVAGWEGYPLNRSTINFVLFFIFTMMGIQLISFYFEVTQQITVSPGIANTAHLTGALIGAIMGRFSFFAWKS